MFDENRFMAYTYSEFFTGFGQVVEISWLNQEVSREDLKKVLKSIRTIEPKVTSAVQVPHGGLGKCTRYQIVQHDYFGSIGGYAEVLEIKDPPDNRCGVVINKHFVYNDDCCFVEFGTVDSARKAFSKFAKNIKLDWEKQRGFKRLVVCGALNPWFYAIGNEPLIGDYAFPEGLQDDSVYRLGKKFVVYTDYDNIPSIKTCMGSRFIRTTSMNYDGYSKREYTYRLVYWSDGSVWNESHRSSHEDKIPRPVEDGEEWIVEAVAQFRRLLAGQTTEFTINLSGNEKFVGKLKADKSVPCVEGDYLLTVKVEGEEKPREGWFFNFKPTPEIPNMVEFFIQNFAKKGKKVSTVEIKEYKTKMGGKKWHGVYFNRTASSNG